jgi:hypothetical protein
MDRMNEDTLLHYTILGGPFEFKRTAWTEVVL